MVKNLRLFGVDVEEKDDGMIVNGPAALRSPEAALESHGDHRIAMSMAILTTFSNGPAVIDNVDCVNTSYPQFWQHMELLGGKVE